MFKTCLASAFQPCWKQHRIHTQYCFPTKMLSWNRCLTAVRQIGSTATPRTNEIWMGCFVACR